MIIWKKLLIGAAVSFILLLIAVLVAPIYLAKGMCGNEIYKEYLSPNGELKAVIFQRDCGATTGFSTQISIIKADSNLKNESGNIYIVNGHPSRVAPQLSWSSSDELIIFKLIDGSEHKAEKQWSSSNTGVRTLPPQAPGKAGGAIPE